MEQFWDPRSKECIVYLQHYKSTKQKTLSNPMIKLQDLVHDNCTARHLWRTNVATKFYYSYLDNQNQGTSVRLDRSEQTIKRPINQLYPLEIIKDQQAVTYSKSTIRTLN